MKKALITGITGQDGSYLAEFLLKKKYKVHGIIRRVALEDKTHRLWRLRNIKKIRQLYKLPKDKIKLSSYGPRNGSTPVHLSHEILLIR